MNLLPTLLTSVTKQDTTIVNQALDTDGNPISGAVVVLYKNNIVVSSRIADSAGVYTFTNLPKGNYKIEFYNPVDLSAYLTNDFGTLSGKFVNTIKPVSASLPTLSPIVAGGKTTGMTVTAGGAGYSSNTPPWITTDDGFIGKAVVDLVTGEILNIDTYVEGTGNPTTTTVQNNYDFNSSIPASITFGTPNGAQDGGAALSQAYTEFNLFVQRIYDAFWAFAYNKTGYTVLSGIKVGQKGISKLTEVVKSPPNSTGMGREKNMAYYPTGTMTVYSDNPSALYNLLNVDFFDGRPGTSTKYNFQLYGSEVVENIPGKPYYGGIFSSYADFLTAKEAALGSAQTVSPPVLPTSTASTSGKISAFLNDLINHLLFVQNSSALKTASLTYEASISSHYSGEPAKNDTTPIQIVNNTGASGLDQQEPYSAYVYGRGSYGDGLFLGQLYYPYVKENGEPTSTNTGIPNPNRDQSITDADFNAIKGYLGTKYLPTPVLDSIGLGDIYRQIQSIDSAFGTTAATTFATGSSLFASLAHELGQTLANPSSWQKQAKDAAEQSFGALSDTAPAALWGRSFDVDGVPVGSGSYFYRHSWDAGTGAYTITKLAK
jgi:hypothetical protein